MQPSTPATPSLLQTFVLRYSSHPSFAWLLQNPNPNPNLTSSRPPT